MNAPESAPEIASRTPFACEVEAGQIYWWCACGRSRTQPFCDGSHKATTYVPVKYVAAHTGRVWFCGCKRSADRPLCDGSHKRLPP